MGLVRKYRMLLFHSFLGLRIPSYSEQDKCYTHKAHETRLHTLLWAELHLSNMLMVNLFKP